MFGTLIGVFITSAGIVIGADQAVFGAGPTDTKFVPKICRTGPRTVATFQGHYTFGRRPGVQVRLQGAWVDVCLDLQKTPTTPLAVQANTFMETLRSKFAEYLKGIPPEHFMPPFGAADPHVSYVAVAGYQETGPLVVVRRLGVRRTLEGPWEAFVEDAPHLAPSRCGSRFHGLNAVANLLMENDPRLPENARKQGEVIAGRGAPGDLDMTTPPGKRGAPLAASAESNS